MTKKKNNDHKKSAGVETNPSVIKVSYPIALIGNFVILGIIAVAVFLMKFNKELYYSSVQEDQIIEWLSFWTFFAAGIIYVQAGRRQYQVISTTPWFLMCLGVFCFFVAMEEISWGQRLIGYCPPSYFLEQNFQQEFNVHNIVDSFWRVQALNIVILGFGVALPALWLIPAIRKLGWKVAMVPPPIFFAPAFLATFILYQRYPWRYSGELVELMLGLCFVFSAMGVNVFFSERVIRRSVQPERILILLIFIGLISIASTIVSQLRLSNQPEFTEITKKEIIALGNDFRKAIKEAKEPIVGCNLHNRIFAHVEEYQIKGLYEGFFQKLVSQGLPEKRAQFFLDPWNTAYWIWQVCDMEKRRVKIFIYSFGRNRSRDSIPWEIREDDIGIPIFESGF